MTVQALKVKYTGATAATEAAAAKMIG